MTKVYVIQFVFKIKSLKNVIVQFVYYQNFEELPACLTYSETICMANIVTSLNAVDSHESCDSSCPVACNYIEYSTKASSVSYPNEYYKSLLMNHSKIIASNISYDKLDKTLLKVNILFILFIIQNRDFILKCS